jgi:hypothetical protein
MPIADIVMSDSPTDVVVLARKERLLVPQQGGGVRQFSARISILQGDIMASACQAKDLQSLMRRCRA